MDNSSKLNSPEGVVCAPEAIPDTTETVRGIAGPEEGSVDTGHDSGVSSVPSGNVESGVSPLKLPKLESKHSVYITSTPKKTAEYSSNPGDDILSCQVILDDPLLSSIDGDLTEHQVGNLSSDDDCDDNYTKLYETKIKADGNSTLKPPDTVRFKKLNSEVRPRICRSHSFSGVPQEARDDENLTSIKRNLFDIPVSPKLKNKVRERLYTLVNSIDGYEGEINLDCEEELRRHTVEQTRGMSHMLPGIKLHQSPNTSQRLHRKHCIHSDTRMNSTLGISRGCDCHLQQEMDSYCVPQSSLHNQTSLSALNTSVSERYGAALSDILATQMRTLHIHQEQLSQEKLSLALGKKDQELNDRISQYQDKLKHMGQMAEGLERKVRQLQKNLSQQEEQHIDQIRQLEDRHEQQLATVHSESEKKIQEAAVKASSTYKEVMDSCDRRISEILAATKERAVAAEGDHQAHIKQLNSTITRLRADKRELEASLRYTTSDLDRRRLSTGRTEGNTEREQEAESDDEKSSTLCSPARMRGDLMKQPDLTRVEVLQGEVKTWRREAEKLQKKMDDSETKYRKLLNEALQDAERKSRDIAERLRAQAAQETVRVSSTVSLLQEKLSFSLSKNMQLQERLIEGEKREQNLAQQLSSLEVGQSETEGCQTALEREIRAAAREEAKYKANQLLDEMGEKYEDLLTSVRHHYRAQIEEYKSAVRVLKREVKRMKKG